MIIDSSCVVAIIRMEPIQAEVRRALDAALSGSTPLRMSAATLLEVSIVVDRMNNPRSSRELDRLVEAYRIEIVPFDHRQATVARPAYHDFGKGSGHPAQLNFGDCFSYAVASQLREPLLCVGDDFGHTDLRSALSSPSDSTVVPRQTSSRRIGGRRAAASSCASGWISADAEAATAWWQRRA